MFVDHEKQKSDAFISGLILGTVVSVIASVFGATLYFDKYLESMRKKCVENGAAHYDSKTGAFTWKNVQAVDEHFADKANLTWAFVDGGTWTSRSAVGTEDNPFLYRIDVIEDGSFDVNRTDSELIPAFDKGRRFETVLKTLDDAKQLCEEAELVAIDKANFVAKYGKE